MTVSLEEMMAAPTRSKMKASSICRFRGCTPLGHLLSTLHDGRCHTPCKTRFRLAGHAFAGWDCLPTGLRCKVSVPLVHVLSSTSSLPELRLWNRVENVTLNILNAY